MSGVQSKRWCVKGYLIGDIDVGRMQHMQRGLARRCTKPLTPEELTEARKHFAAAELVGL